MSESGHPVGPEEENCVSPQGQGSTSRINRHRGHNDRRKNAKRNHIKEEARQKPSSGTGKQAFSFCQREEK